MRPGRLLVASAVFPFVVGGCASSYPHLSFAVEQRILRETTLDDLPEDQAWGGDSVVRVLTSGTGACSGTLVGPRHVLTAQHCVVKLDRLRELTMEPSRLNDIRVELGGDYLPWGRVGVREIHTCAHYMHDVEHDIAVLILSRPLPPEVPRLAIAVDIPTEAVVFELAGFGTATKARKIPGGWFSTTTSRHSHRGPVISTTSGTLTVDVPAVPGDSGGPILDVATGRVAAVVSRGRPREGTSDSGRVIGARLTACTDTLAKALAR